MRNIKTVLLEAIVIGIMSIICGYVWYFIISKVYTDTTNSNSYYLPMTINIFLIGFSLHFILEYTLLNEKWCKITYP
jgi:hypothetical protein